MVELTIVKPQQYCVVVNTLGKDGRPQLGHRELRCGPLTFFLQPGIIGVHQLKRSEQDL